MDVGNRSVEKFILLAVLVVAALVRLCGLTDVPPPLNQDEAARGYDAWCLYETGADHHGEPWPLFLKSFGPGDYPGALSTYLTIPFVAVLGPTVTAMRLPCALLGVATVWAMFCLVKNWMGVREALIASLILALDPWHIMFSRTALEAAYSPFFLVAALLAWARAGFFANSDQHVPASRHAATWAFSGGLLMGGHAWCYAATRLFTPLFLLGMGGWGLPQLAAMWKNTNRRSCLYAAWAGLFVGFSPIWVTAMTHPQRLVARGVATVITSKPWPVSAMFGEFLANLARNFNPTYLFWECDDLSGILLPHIGKHLLVLAPLFAVGLATALAGCRRSLRSRIMIAWVLLAVVPAAICSDWNPNPIRTICGLAAFPIVCADGAMALGRLFHGFSKRLRRAALIVASVALVINAAYFAYRYFRVVPRLLEKEYQTALLKAITVAGKHAREADFILVTNQANQPYIYALLFQPIQPSELKTMPKVDLDDRLGYLQVLRMGKYYFAPRDPDKSSVVGDRFKSLMAEWPATARGLVVERQGHFSGGQLLERVQGGDGLDPDQNFEVRWWSPGEKRP